jgi:MoaA/NifB/PqqE/SkfB family radical SAM enzyme
MTTNGSTGAEGAKKIIEAGITQVFVTIDAPDENDPGSIRRYKNAFEFAKELSKLKKNGKNFIYYIYSVLTKYNYKKAPDHINELYSALYPHFDGVYLILIKKFPGVAYLGLNYKQIREYREDLLPKILNILQNYYKNKEDAENSSTYLLAKSIAGYNKEESKFYSKGFFPGKIVAPCYLSLSQLTISASGCAHQCLTQLRNTNESPLGNLYEQSLKEIKEKMLSSKRIISKVPLIPACMHICNPGYGFFNYLVFSMLKEANLYKYLPNKDSPNKEAIRDIKKSKLLKEAIRILENKDCIWALAEYNKEYENYKNKK